MVASLAGQVALTLGRAEPDEVTGALDRLVREHGRFVFRVAYAVLRNHHDAEDAAQETFVRVLRQRARLHEIADVRAWIGTIAWRTALERRRDPRTDELDAAAEDVGALRASGASAEEVVERGELSTLVWGLVATLPVELRDALTLATLREMTAAEAGIVLGVPEGTVRNRVHRARQVLRQKLVARLERRR